MATVSRDRKCCEPREPIQHSNAAVERLSQERTPELLPEVARKRGSVRSEGRGVFEGDQWQCVFY